MNGVGALAERRFEAPLFRDRDECELFVKYVLSDEAIRSPAARKTRHQKKPLEGIHIGYPVRCAFRGSDRVERIVVCVMAFKSMGFTLNSAYVGVADLLQTKLGKSRRGRQPRRQRTGELMNKAETVRSLYNKRGGLATRIGMYLTGFRSWRAWALVVDEGGLERLTQKFTSERGEGTAQWRAAIDAVRRDYSGYKYQVEKKWADVLRRFAIPAEAEQALRDLQLNPTWVEAALEAAMLGDGAIAAFRDEDFLGANGAWASFLTSRWIDENPSEARRAGL